MSAQAMYRLTGCTGWGCHDGLLVAALLLCSPLQSAMQH